MPKSIRAVASRLLTVYGIRLPPHPGKWRVVDWFVSVFHLQDLLDSTVIVERRGIRFALEPKHYIDRCLYYLGTYESRDTEVVRKMIRPGWVVCDIGANIGWYTLLAAQQMKGLGVIHALTRGRGGSCEIETKPGIEFSRQREGTSGSNRGGPGGRVDDRHVGCGHY